MSVERAGELRRFHIEISARTPDEECAASATSNGGVTPHGGGRGTLLRAGVSRPRDAQK